MTYMNNILSEDLIVGTRLGEGYQAGLCTYEDGWLETELLNLDKLRVSKTMVFHGLHAKHYVTSSCGRNEWRLDTT